MRNLSVAVIDIGSPKKNNLGWAFDGLGKSVGGSNLDECIDVCAQALKVGPLAVGFEAPTFVPVRSKPETLTDARIGECASGVNRPFSAGAGAAVLVTSLVIVPYVLSKLRNLVPNARATLDWQSPLEGNTLLLFEAFVTNQRKTDDLRHIVDAQQAIAAFQRGMLDPTAFQSSVSDTVCLNLVSAALLRAEWTKDIGLLSQPCLVVKT
jgi:hypothetical protein